MKKVAYNIKYCNSLCPYFYHKYGDDDNIWCDKLEKRIYEYDGGLIWGDMRERPIPSDCPLPDADVGEHQEKI